MIKRAARAGLPLCLLLAPIVIRAQTPTPTPPETPDQAEVLRVYTEIVQTDVMVFDKQGHFVNGLKSGDFELRIDGKLKPVDFFEQVVAGSQNEEAQLAAARGSARPNSSGANAPAPLDRGRPIFFYVDDLHMDLTGIKTTKELITRFIQRQMGQNDEVAIASASGSVGFLQQLTDNKDVLRAAVERLKFHPLGAHDLERPTMTEYQALLITQYDAGVSDYFITETMRMFPGLSRESAEAQVNSRARVLIQQGGVITANTLSALEGLVKSADKLPGRKLIFFLSGGFFVDDRNSDSMFRLQRITSAAAKSSVVIYSLDTRGLVASLGDISQSTAFSPALIHANNTELIASQDGLNALAADTGGKTVFNTNNLEPGLERALHETATYYLLAWKPEQSQQSTKFRRIEVKIVGRPDLTVKVRRGFFDREPEAAKPKKPKDDKNKPVAEVDASKTAEAQLRKTMLGVYPERQLPVSLDLSFLASPTRGPMLTASFQVPKEFLTFTPDAGKQVAGVTVIGAVFDDKGHSGASFKNHVTLDADSLEAAHDGGNLTYSYPLYVGPGLYQVRVGLLDEKSGRQGTAHGWIQVPAMQPGQLALSSVLMGVRTQQAISDAAKTPGSGPVDMSVDHHFSSDGVLRFLLIIYNPALAADSKPDLAIQVQIIRDEQPVVTTALKKVGVDGSPDLTRIPYAAELSLNGLPAGRYLLQVTVVDRVSKKSSSQHTRFEVN